MSDYLMRQIEDMARFLAQLVFQRQPADTNFVTEEGGISSGNLLSFRLRQLVREKKLNEAENLLFEEIRAEPRDEYLPVALDFYEALGEFSDEELAAADFSRQEVAEGLSEIHHIYTKGKHQHG